MLTPEELKSVIAKLECQKQRDKIKTASKLTGAQLDVFIQKDVEKKMQQEKLESYQIACKIRKLEISSLTETKEKELKEAQEIFQGILKQVESLNSSALTTFSKTQKQKLDSLFSFIGAIDDLSEDLKQKCKQTMELHQALWACRKKELSPIFTPRLLDDAVQHMVNPTMLMCERTGKLVDSLREFNRKITDSGSPFFIKMLQKYSLESSQQEALQKKILAMQELDKKNQDFASALKKAEEQAQQLANKEVNSGKPQAGVVVQETKLEDEETLLIGLRKFLDERIASSRKGLKEFGEGTVKGKQDSFHHIFKTKALFDKLGTPLNERQSQFLQYMYKSNEQYYLSIKKQIELLKTPITLVDWSRFLEKIQALDTARFEDAKKELEKLGVNDSGILMQLLIPVYRLVFKFQKEQLLPLTRQISETEVRILRGKREGLLSGSSSIKPAAVRTKGTANDDLEKILAKNLSPLQIVSEVSCFTQMIQQEILTLRARTNAAGDLDEASEVVMPQSPVLPEVSFSSENFIADRELLQRADALNMISDLFSRNPTVCYRDFYNMLRVLRGENSVDSLNGHVMFQCPILWGGMSTSPQVLVGIRHTSGMPTVSQIQDPNILRDLRNACREAGMTPGVIEAIQVEQQNLAVAQSEATVVVTATVSNETVQPSRRTGRTGRTERKLR